MPYIKEVCVAGDTIEVEKYYSVRWNCKGEKREKRTEQTPEAVKRINQRIAGKNLRRLLNNNFQDGDLLIRLDFHKVHPKDSEEIQKYITKAIRKMKAEFAKTGNEMKYVYVKEVGPKGSRHIHMVVNKCSTDLLVKCWPYGGIHIDPLNTNGQYSKIAEYFIKYASKTEETEGKLIGKRWYASRNLKKPTVKKTVIKANRFRQAIKVPKGFYLEKESFRSGVSELTGFEYLSYTMIKAKVTERNG